jgi:RecA-family ATPase
MNLEEELANAASEDPENEAEEQEQPRYVLRNASYALQPLPPIEWIIDQLISAGSVSMFYGEPGSKKTYALLSLAVCVALGKFWLGLEVQPQKVLFVDEESGERRLALRLGAAIRGELGDEATPLEFVSLAQFKLDNKDDRKELQQLIEETEAGLVVIDALADVMDGDENSKQDTQPVFTALRKIAELTSAAIIVIHHSNKSGGYRGSSAIKGALDLMVKIESEDGSNWINFKSEKSRDGAAVNLTAVANWTEDQFYLLETDTRMEEKQLNRSQKYVVRYLEKNGASSMPDIMGAADQCSSNAARQAVYALVEMGKVYRTNPEDKGRGAVAYYDLTKKEKQESEA